MDGTVYLGNQILPGAVQIISAIRSAGKPVVFITNKPLEDRIAYAQKLSGLGIPTSPDDIITSAFVLGSYLAAHHPNYFYYVVGEARLRQELASFNLNILDELVGENPEEVITPTGITAVIIAFDRQITYRKLNTAFQALLKGVPYFATNPDLTCPMLGGSIPDAGALIAYFECLTGRRPDLIAGKPSPIMMEIALQKLNLPPSQVFLVGDRLETDIHMGKQAGMITALTLTGITTPGMLSLSLNQPDYIVTNLIELHQLLFQG
jgi:HAD superfamily hydrolase (TIGR01450 family)